MLTGNTQTLMKIKTERSKGANTGFGVRPTPPAFPTATATHPENCTCCLLGPRPSFSPKKNHKRKKQEQTKYLQISCLHESST